MSSSVIRVENINKSFGKSRILTNISFDVQKGESFVVIGSSGAGKSTLIKILLGISSPDSGKIYFNNKDYSNISKHKRIIINKQLGIGILFQSAALFDSLNVFENVVFGLTVHGFRNKKQLQEIALENLHLVGLNADVLDKYPDELSGGMKKRVSIARLIATKPKILFFDEPTSGLDPLMSETINDLIIKSCNYLGATSFIITHDMRSAKKIGNKLAFLSEQQLLWTGTPEEIGTTSNINVKNFVNGVYY